MINDERLVARFGEMPKGGTIATNKLCTSLGQTSSSQLGRSVALGIGTLLSLAFARGLALALQRVSARQVVLIKTLKSGENIIKSEEMIKPQRHTTQLELEIL